MKDKIDHIAILCQMILLLKIGKFSEWAEALEKIKKDFDNNPREKSLELLSMYRGAGSLNDIVFYKDGQPLISENSEFDDLRISLFYICKNFI